MLITYDPDADAVYVQLRIGQVAATEEVGPNIMLDFDVNNTVLGIEILSASKQIDGDVLSVSLRLLANVRQVEPLAAE